MKEWLQQFNKWLRRDWVNVLNALGIITNLAMILARFGDPIISVLCICLFLISIGLAKYR